MPYPCTKRDLIVFRDAAVDIAKRCGRVIQEAFYQPKSIESKSCATDLVTETDRRVEQMIHSYLKEKFPDSEFIGEETFSDTTYKLLNNPTWVVDPIDGTTNFVQKFPYICTSIGLLVNKQVEVAVIYNPILDLLFTAVRGEGSYLNGERIQCNRSEELTDAIVIVEIGSSREESRLDFVFENLKRITVPARGIRSLGSAALNMCHVAWGAADAYYEYGIHCWDMSAGDLIVREAGGVVTDPTGAPFNLFSRRVLCASTEQLRAQITPLIRHTDYDMEVDPTSLPPN